MKECVNCTAMQMQTMAKNSPVGYAFVYDLAHNIIRKYEVYMDSDVRSQSRTPDQYDRRASCPASKQSRRQ